MCLRLGKFLLMFGFMFGKFVFIRWFYFLNMNEVKVVNVV